MARTATVKTDQLVLCASRRVGHTWNDPENQSWENAEPVRVGRRLMARVRCISRCDRCGSERIEPYLINTSSQLVERDTVWYRHSDEYSKRDRFSVAELDWKRIPAAVLRSLG